MIDSYKTSENNIIYELRITEIEIKNQKNFKKSPLNHLKTIDIKPINLKGFYGSLDYTILILNIIGIIFYQISFIRCNREEENYCIIIIICKYHN